jgi:hypothetical protein
MKKHPIKLESPEMQALMERVFANHTAKPDCGPLVIERGTATINPQAFQALRLGEPRSTK